jgi:hypothetical protein
MHWILQYPLRSSPGVPHCQGRHVRLVCYHPMDIERQRMQASSALPALPIGTGDDGHTGALLPEAQHRGQGPGRHHPGAGCLGVNPHHVVWGGEPADGGGHVGARLHAPLPAMHTAVHSHERRACSTSKRL